MKYRFLYSEGINQEILTNLIDGLDDWEEISDYFEKNKAKQNLVNNIKDRIKNFDFAMDNNNYSINYENATIFPGNIEKIWQKSKYTKIILPKSNFIIIQQPTDIFERLFKMSIEKFTHRRPESIFTGNEIISIINGLQREFTSENWNLNINRVIFERINFEGRSFIELNIKQDKISISFLKSLSENAKKFQAFTFRAHGYFNNELKYVSFRIDRYGKGLLYGNHSDNFYDFFLNILTKYVKKVQIH